MDEALLARLLERSLKVEAGGDAAPEVARDAVSAIPVTDKTLERRLSEQSLKV